MKTIKVLGDTLNKVTDTSAVFKFRLWNDGLAQDVTDKTVSVTVANASGYLFDVTPKNNGTEVELDFSDAKLKELTPDTYKLEINVTNADGDIEVYPSNGAVEFLVNRNLKSQTGALVPQVTFDAVLEGVDKKIAEYVKTIAKGDKGDTGPQGPKGDKGDKGDTGAQGPKGDKADDSELVHTAGNETIAGDKYFTGNVTVPSIVANGTPLSALKTSQTPMWFNSTLTAYRIGNIVTIVNNKPNTSTIYNTTTSQEAIPLGYRPVGVSFYPAIYESSVVGEIQINPNGSFTAHGTFTGPYHFTATYITNDAFPN